MKIFYCKHFDTRSNGADWVVLANSKEEAKEKLLEILHSTYNHEPSEITAEELTKEVTIIRSY